MSPRFPPTHYSYARLLDFRTILRAQMSRFRRQIWAILIYKPQPCTWPRCSLMVDYSSSTSPLQGSLLQYQLQLELLPSFYMERCILSKSLFTFRYLLAKCVITWDSFNLCMCSKLSGYQMYLDAMLAKFGGGWANSSICWGQYRHLCTCLCADDVFLTSYWCMKPSWALWDMLCASYKNLMAMNKVYSMQTLCDLAYKDGSYMAMHVNIFSLVFDCLESIKCITL